MKQKTVIDSNNLPSELPYSSTLLGWMALDHWHAPSWGYGAYVGVMAIIWILLIANKFSEKYIDLRTGKHL